MAASPDQHGPPGVVELREDVPLKTSGAASGSAGGAASGAAGCAGPRLILGAFAVLSAAITLALLTQIYYGDYEVVPHGSVAGSGAACARAGAAALRAGGRALDAAAAAALCLAVRAPHRTGLDASGSLLYWEYRTARAQGPLLAEWGAAGGAASSTVGGAASGAASGATSGADGVRPPRLVAALAALHARYGALPWSTLLQPALDAARGGFPVSAALARAAAERGAAGYAAGGVRADPALADYLAALQRNTSAELCAAWDCESAVRTSRAAGLAAGAWRVWAGGAGGRAAAAALATAFPPPPAPAPPTATEAVTRVVEALRQKSLAASAGAEAGAGVETGVASGLAVVDPQDTYVALVTGLSRAFGSEGSAGGWPRDAPRAPLDLAPALLVDQHVCGTRLVVGAESGAALAQAAAAALAGAAPADAVEGGRVSLSPDGAVELESGRPPPPSALLAALLAAPPAAPLAAPPAAPPAAPLNATPPYAAVNVVQQRGDALLSHADSRGGGFASRF